MLQNCALPCVPLTGIAKHFATETARARSDNRIRPREDPRRIGVLERAGAARICPHNRGADELWPPVLKVVQLPGLRQGLAECGTQRRPGALRL